MLTFEPVLVRWCDAWFAAGHVAVRAISSANGRQNTSSPGRGYRNPPIAALIDDIACAHCLTTRWPTHAREVINFGCVSGSVRILSPLRLPVFAGATRLRTARD